MNRTLIRSLLRLPVSALKWKQFICYCVPICTTKLDMELPRGFRDDGPVLLAYPF